MIDSINQLDFNKKYTYADYLTWRLKERVELIKGRLFKMSPAPNIYHQQVAGNLYFEFRKSLQEKDCQVFTAPFDVRFPKEQPDADGKIEDVVQPDICIVCDPDKLDFKGCVGAPDLIVEILSPSSSKKDLNEKYQLYQEQRVKEYWVVHPVEQTLLVYTLNEKGKYMAGKLMTRGDVVTTSIFKDFVLPLDQVFEEKEVDY